MHSLILTQPNEFTCRNCGYGWDGPQDHCPKCERPFRLAEPPPKSSKWLAKSGLAISLIIGAVAADLIKEGLDPYRAFAHNPGIYDLILEFGILVAILAVVLFMVSIILWRR